MPQLTDIDLIELAVLLRDDSDSLENNFLLNLLKKGLCRGASGMLMQAMLAQDEKSFFDRLDFIASYKEDFNQLKKEIENAKIKEAEYARAKAHDTEKPDEKTYKLLDILAFLEGMIVYLYPSKHSYLFNKAYVTQEDLNVIFSIVQSNQLKETDLSVLSNEPYAFDKLQLNAYLADLATLLGRKDAVLPIFLGSFDHSVCLKFDRSKNKWLYFDLNDSSRYPESKSYYRELNNEELAESIFTSFTFSSNESKHVVFNTTIVTNLQETEDLKKSFADFNSKYSIKPEQALMYDSSNIGLLYIACQNGHVEVAEALLTDPRTNVNQVANEGFTCLAIACQNGHIRVVEALLEDKRIQLNQRNNFGDTALYIACQKGHTDIVKCLLKNPLIDINQTNNEDASPLHIACQEGHITIVAALLEDLRTNVNYADKEGFTPLTLACQNGQTEIVKLFLKNPLIKINQTHNDYTLYIACQNGHLDVVNELLKYPGIKINQINPDSVSPLAIACQNGHVAVVEALLADPRTNVNQVDDEGFTPLALACQNGHTTVVKGLLRDPRININQANNQSLTPLHIACQEGYIAIIDTLLEDVRIDDINQVGPDGVSSLVIGCLNGHIEVVKALLNDPRTTVNQADDEGFISLQVACLSQCTNGQEELFQLLLLKKASLTHKNNEGQTALDIALKQNNYTAISVLLEFMENNKINPRNIMSPHSRKLALNWSKVHHRGVNIYLQAKQRQHSQNYIPHKTNSSFFKKLDELDRSADLEQKSRKIRATPQLGRQS